MYLSEDNIAIAVNTAKRAPKIFTTEMLRNYVPSVAKPVTFFDHTSHKKRTIVVPSPTDLVVQHAQMNILKPIFRKSFYRLICSSISGRGLHSAKSAVEGFIRKHGDYYFLQIDIKHFFENIDHNILKEKLKIIADFEFKQELFKIIDSYSPGLPIGFYTSPWYANFYLSKFDHWVKEVLRIPFYCRYMDDMLFIEKTKEDLLVKFELIKMYLADLKLEIKPNFKIGCFGNGDFADYLGFRFYDNRTTLRKRLLSKIRRKVRKVKKKKRMTVFDARQTLPYWGFLKITDTYEYSKEHLNFNFNKCRKIISNHDKAKNSKKKEQILLNTVVRFGT